MWLLYWTAQISRAGENGSNAGPEGELCVTLTRGHRLPVPPKCVGLDLAAQVKACLTKFRRVSKVNNVCRKLASVLYRGEHYLLVLFFLLRKAALSSP